MKCGKIVACLLAALLGVGFGASCKHKQAAEREDRTVLDIPADSPFAKITKGMSQGEVINILGQPGETQTGPGRGNWIPFNYGGRSTVLTVLHYKGQGRIYLENQSRYGGTMVVVKVLYDPNELGFAK